MVLRVVLLGRTGVGKTCLMLRISRNKFPSYVPRMEFECSAKCEVESKTLSFHFFEPDGKGNCERISYPQADVVLICFAANDRRSFDEVQSVWMPLVIQWCGNVAVLLVATKSDLEDESKSIKDENVCVSNSESDILAKELHFEGSFKCSAVTGDGIQNLCQRIHHVSKSPRKKFKNATIHVAGNTGVGKTSLASSLAGIAMKQKLPYIQNQNDTSCICSRKNGKLGRVAIFDNLNYGWQRKSIDIRKACAILLCYSVDCRRSFSDIRDTWAPTLRRDYPDVPLFLVATKIDSRENKETHDFLKKNKISIVTSMEGAALAKKIGAIKYMECSSTTGAGVKCLLDKVVNKSIKLMKRRNMVEVVTSRNF